MTYSYTPEENDFLNYLYYATTKSQRVRKKRTMNKLVILFLYFIAGLFLYNSQGPINSGLFFILCLPMYFFYTYFEKRQYKRHFIKYIKANYSSEIGINTTIGLEDEGVTIAVGEAKTTMPWTEIETINETGTLILIEEKNQNAIVIPKQKANGVAELITELKGIAAVRNIPFNEDLNWKWK